MIKNSWLFFLLLYANLINAQYTDLINSNRPGYSESPYSIGSDVFQFEGGVSIFNFQYQEANKGSYSSSYQQQFRYGTKLEKLEAHLNFEYGHYFTNLFSVKNKQHNDLGSVVFGVKHLIYDHEIKSKKNKIRSWKKRNQFNLSRLIPSVGLGANYNVFINNNPFNHFSVGLLLQNELNPYWNIITNVYFRGIGNKKKGHTIYLTSAYGFHERWSVYVEGQQTFYDSQKSKDIGAGITYLLNKDTEIDLSMKRGVVNDDKLVSFSVGAAWRIDKHLDRFIKVNEPETIQNPFESKTITRIYNSIKEGVTVCLVHTGYFFKQLFFKKEMSYKERKIIQPKMGNTLTKELENRPVKAGIKEEENSSPSKSIHPINQ